MANRIMHLMTQDNQSYGSVRKCCEICGLGMVGRDDEFWKQHTWVDTAENYHTNWEEPLTLCKALP